MVAVPDFLEISSLYYSLLSNQVGSARIVAITVDASLHGWGALIRWWNNIYGVIIVGHLPDTDDMLHQDRCKEIPSSL